MLRADPLHDVRHVRANRLPRSPLFQHIDELLRRVGGNGRVVHDELVEGSQDFAGAVLLMKKE